MIAKLTKDIVIPSSSCDVTGTVSMPGLFAMFCDLATEHADILNVGLKELSPKDYYWVAVKTRVKIYARPQMGEKAEISTWPDAPEVVRAVRNYSLACNGSAVAEGRTEWTVINIKTGKIIGAKGIFPDGIQFLNEPVWADPFARLKDDFDGEPFAKYTIRSTDIDVGGHMNNALYVRAVMSLFSTAELQQMNITDFEISYKNQCYEGETIRFYRKDTDNDILIKISRSDDKTAAFIKMK